MVAAAPPPIEGRPTDPPPKPVPAVITRYEDRAPVVGLAYRAFARFSYAKTPLLAAGTSYYVFLSLFALLAVAYGAAASLGAERFASFLTDALEEALPGLVGSQGIDPARLQSFGQTISVVGAVILLFSGTGAMVAANSSLHLIYGAPPDPRNFLLARLRLLGWLLVVGPLIALSFVAPGLIVGFGGRLSAALGLAEGVGRTALSGAGVLATYALDVLILWILLGVLGGIRPARRPRLIGAFVGGVVMIVLTFLSSLIIAVSVAKPQYGALAAPIAILLMLYLLSSALYASAALTAGIIDHGE